MFNPVGLTVIATLTEVRNDTSAVLKAAQKHGGVLLQRNNKPEAVVVAIDVWRDMHARLEAQE